MMKKRFPIPAAELKAIIEEYPTPFYIYDESALRANARRLNEAFSIFPDFQEYFAVKATPNPQILKLFKEESCGVDCSSLAELLLAEKVGFHGKDLFLTSNDTPAEEFKQALKMGAIVNLDDISHIEFLERNVGLPAFLSLRYNPGPLRTGNAIIGNPVEAKYGFTRDQVFEGFAMMKEKGVKEFGLHTMVASNELNMCYFLETARMMFDLVLEIKEKLDIDIKIINLGGGIGIPYFPEDTSVDLFSLAADIKALYDEKITGNGLFPAKLALESGRMMAGPYGYLVTQAIHKKDTYKRYIGLDACMANLMRPALYGAYHHITVLGKEDLPRTEKYDVVGSLCENNDKFAIDRYLPPIEPGDVVIFHDAGAHGHAMGFNYNGKLRSAELLWRENGGVKLIRRAETMEDLFATLDFDAL